MTNNQYQRQEYVARINRVIDYIERNLDTQLSLNDLAEVACFSPFHFHRTFGAITGETLYQFISRLRVEKAASQLLTNLKSAITDIALENGFSSSQTFARSFKSRYGMSAGEWRDGGYEVYRKKCNTDSKGCEADSGTAPYTDDDNGGEDTLPVHSLLQRRNEMKQEIRTEVKVETLPEMNVAYIRHVGPYKGDEQLFAGLWGRLMQWAGPRGLMAQQDLKCLSVYHDSPEITEEAKLRTSVCLTIPEGTPVDGDVGTMKIDGGAYAMGHFEINSDQYEQAWQFMYGSWLPQSGYQPDDRAAFEMCLNNPDEHPEHKHIFNICVPVKPL